MATVTCWSHRCRTNCLLTAILMLAGYALVFDQHDDVTGVIDDAVDWSRLEQELDSANPVHIVAYTSPLNQSIFLPAHDDDVVRLPASAKHLARRSLDTPAVYQRVWTLADGLIDNNQMWPDSPEVDAILDAMAHAPIVGVDVLDIGEYESGTADKWIVTLLGGQKAVMKIVWEDKGGMKIDALCNSGFEMPTAEIAAFHLHRLIGFRNTPYVTGRLVDVESEILPHASLSVAKQIIRNTRNGTCVRGKCYDCRDYELLCRHSGVFEVSLAYWVTRKLRLYTFPDKYMPYSTPRMTEWSRFGFNDRTYCETIQRTVEPYSQRNFYLDLFDFAVIDTLMYHFDSKHYSVVDRLTSADGLVIRLDHGRAFCAYDRDDEQIFLAPISQCCTLRKTTYSNLLALQGGQLTSRLRQALDRDPLAPILQSAWFPALERRLKLILALVERCIAANGRQSVLVRN